MRNKKISDMLVSGAIKIVPFSDKILYEDNDGDGIPNKDDPYPDEPFDDRFMIVDDYNYYPDIDFMDINKYGTGSTEFSEVNGKYYGTQGKDGRTLCYNRNMVTTYDQFMYNFLLTLDAASFLPGIELCAGKIAVDKFIEMPQSSTFLGLFLVGKCEKYEINDNKMKSIITTHCNNLYHYMLNLNALMDVSEQSLIDGSSLIFSSKTDDVFKIACYTDKQNKCPTHVFKKNNKDAKVLDEGLDWSFAIGDSYCGLVGKAERKGSTYTLNYKIYLMDYYEWGYHVDGGDKPQHMMHECGLAKEYPIYGIVENTITWEEGYRITEPKEVYDQVNGK